MTCGGIGYEGLATFGLCAFELQGHLDNQCNHLAYSPLSIIINSSFHSPSSPLSAQMRLSEHVVQCRKHLIYHLV